MQRLIEAYKLWHLYLRHFPKDFRYTLGNKIDQLFLEIIETVLQASNLVRGQKLPGLQKASVKLDLLKFFLQIAWENKALDNNKYIKLSEILSDIGRQLGGWQKQLLKETPPTGGE